MIDSKLMMKEAVNEEKYLIQTRRQLHRNAETGFDIPNTVAYVKTQLEEMGYQPKMCTDAGLVAVLEGEKPGKTFLLRADMDGLPIREEAAVEYACGNGNMHACGHDMHTAMLLGAAKILKAHQQELCGRVKFMFQPAEELLAGSAAMIEAGVLEEPEADAGMMIHVMVNSPFETGSVIVSAPGVSAPSADYFEIKVQGAGCHGAMPNTGVDPLNVGAHVLIALQEIQAREIGLSEQAMLTIGSFRGGTVPNAIPDNAVLAGSLRCYDEEVRNRVKGRIGEIAASIATAFRAVAEVTFTSSCPTLVNDEQLAHCMYDYMKELLGEGKAFSVEQLRQMSGGASKTAGSEDFAYVSQQIPAIMVALAAGRGEDGYTFPLHHPKVCFDEKALTAGSAAFAYTALRWLSENQ